MAYVNVAEWKPEQVTEWLKGLDNVVLTYVHSFLNNEVNGQQLLSLRPDDLDHLGVQKLGHQELILEAVEHLRNFHYELDRENLQLLALRLSCRARSLYKELLQHGDSERVSTQTMADVANIITAVKPIACWLGRSPFAGNYDYQHRKMELLNLSLKIATCAQRDHFAERPVEEIRHSCDELASLADSIIRDIQDPLLLQPASLDLATVKKRAGDDLGFFIQPSFHGIHQISELKFSSPAQQCGKIEAGDEIVQVNYQTVVGWQSKKVMFLLEESPTDVFLTLKKRPRHTKVYGQIYIKPYRLPSKKRATPYTRWHENLPSPRPELLTIPDFEIPLPRSTPKQGVEQLEAVNLVDSEPLVSSSSSGDDDDDDTAFLPGAADLAQVSPTSMRLYLPKQRAAVQRRATVTGASPTSRRPPVNIEQLWRELQLEHQWRGGTPGTPLFQLREKPGGISSSLMSMADVLRPTTCLGIEKSINSSLYKDKYPKETIFSSSMKGESKAKDVDLIPVRNDEMKRASPAREIEQGMEEPREQVERSFSSPVFNLQRPEPVIDSVKNKTSFKTCNESCEIIVSPVEDPQLSSARGVAVQEMKDYFAANYVVKSNNLVRNLSVENQKVVPIDESIMNIPPGHMKYIDDTSDSNLISDGLEESETPYGGGCDNRDFKNGAQQRLSSTSEVPLTYSHGNNLKLRSNSQAPKSVDKLPFSACCINDLKEAEGSPVVPGAHQVQNIPVHAQRILNSNIEAAKIDREREEAETLSNAVVTKYPVKKSNILELPPRNQNRNSAKNKPSPPQKPPQHCFNTSSNMSNNSNTNTLSQNRFAQSFSQFTNVRPVIPLICSPKTLKKRNILLAKRRNVSLKDLGGAECEGWLLHRCRWNGAGASLGTTWTRTWFILKGSIFYGFKSPHASKANIMISLPGFTVSLAEEVKSKKYAFKVYHTGTVFYFAAETEPQLASWMDAIAAGTALQDNSGKPLEFSEIFFSETDEDSEPETEVESGTCFPTSKSSKFAGLLGSSSSPSTCRSQQNLASDTKIGNEVQKKFGSLKKFGRKVHDISGSALHHEGNTSSSLDRKYLCFLGSGRNSTLPVPTAQFRSYRRVSGNTPSRSSSEAYNPKVHELTMRGSANISYEATKEAVKKSLHTTNHLVDTLEYSKLKQDKEYYAPACNLSSHVILEANRGKESDVAQPSVANKSPLPDLLLKPTKMCDMRDRSTHASNPTLQLSGDMSDYRLAAERLREFNMQRNRAREDTTGFVTLEEFMLSRQEEERKSERLRARYQEEKSTAPTEVTRPSHDVIRQASFKSTNSSRSVGTSSKDTSCDASSSPESARTDHSDGRRGNSELKSVAQYQPPPPPVTSRRSPDDSSPPQPLALAFEMHLGERESSGSKSTLKFRNIFSSSKSSSHRSQQPKQHQLDVPSEGWPKALLSSPRLRRALFRDRQNSGPKGSSSSESTCSSISPPVAASTPDWSTEGNADASLAQTKPTMGVAMLGKRPSRRTAVVNPSAPAVPVSSAACPPSCTAGCSPACIPPDYPGLEYPPVFEPETYTLADASTLRSRPSRTHSDK